MTHAMTLRLPDDVYEALRQEAFDKRMTLTAVIVGRVAEHSAALAAEAAKTECLHGHPLSGSNLRIDSRGYRECRTCRKRRTVERGIRRSLARTAKEGDQ